MGRIDYVMFLIYSTYVEGKGILERAVLISLGDGGMKLRERAEQSGTLAVNGSVSHPRAVCLSPVLRQIDGALRELGLKMEWC